MTERLNDVIHQLQQLSVSEQDELAELIARELAERQQWATSFADSQDLLADLADEAVADHRAGRTRALDDLL